MRNFFFFLFSCTLFFSCTLKTEYVNNIEQQQKQKIADFYNPARSPLDSNEIKQLGGIFHFKVDEDFHVNATITWLPFTGYFDLAHSGGTFRPYRKAAELHFTLNGKPQKLTAYQNEKLATQRILFIPFSDPTNGKETYGGGRYLDATYAPNASETDLELNLCYFPYCAYSHRFSCPIVPAENTLTEPVYAGERYKPGTN